MVQDLNNVHLEYAGGVRMKTDIEIAQEAAMLPIKDVAASIGVEEDDLELYGKYKAKFSDE